MKTGLKLWSVNTDHYYREAKRLYDKGIFDFIELYVVPGTTDTIGAWKRIGIPMALHAPHFMHGVNLADETKLEFNKTAFREVAEFFDALNASYTVVHSGINGTLEETVRQLSAIRPPTMLIENKPYVASVGDNFLCRGSTVHEITDIIRETACGFCLDVGHAICAANSLGVEPYGYLAAFEALKPSCYHLSDNALASPNDGHMHLGKGEYDFKRIFSIISSGTMAVIETGKDSKDRLDDFERDIKWLKSLK